mmetsp:Transcript_11174/g.25391  ORF Transcript_11174/g.25391 Transcript_11174/m.25391 type:complete len:226 (+) Transcript_11174:266-943(+)
MRIVLDTPLLLLLLIILTISITFGWRLLHWRTFSILNCQRCCIGFLILVRSTTLSSVTRMLCRVIPYLFLQYLVSLFHLLEAFLRFLCAPILVRVHLLRKLAIRDVELLLGCELRDAEVLVVVLLGQCLPFCSNCLVCTRILQQALPHLMHQPTHLNVRELVHELGHVLLVGLQEGGDCCLAKDLLASVSACDHSPSLARLRVDLSGNHHAARIVVGHRLACEVW